MLEIIALRRHNNQPQLTDDDRTVLGSIAAALLRSRRLGWPVTPETLLRSHRRRITSHWTQPADAAPTIRLRLSSSSHPRKGPPATPPEATVESPASSLSSAAVQRRFWRIPRSATDGCCPHSTLKREEPLNTRRTLLYDNAVPALPHHTPHRRPQR